MVGDRKGSQAGWWVVGLLGACLLLLTWEPSAAWGHAQKNTNTIYNSGPQCIRITGIIGHGSPVISRGETKSRSGGCANPFNKAAGNLRQRFYSYKRVGGNYYLCRSSNLYINGTFTWILAGQRDWNFCSGGGRYKTRSTGAVWVNSLGAFVAGEAWSPGHNF